MTKMNEHTVFIFLMYGQQGEDSMSNRFRHSMRFGHTQQRQSQRQRPVLWTSTVFGDNVYCRPRRLLGKEKSSPGNGIFDNCADNLIQERGLHQVKRGHAGVELSSSRRIEAARREAEVASHGACGKQVICCYSFGSSVRGRGKPTRCSKNEGQWRRILLRRRDSLEKRARRCCCKHYLHQEKSSCVKRVRGWQQVLKAAIFQVAVPCPRIFPCVATIDISSCHSKPLPGVLSKVVIL